MHHREFRRLEFELGKLRGLAAKLQAQDTATNIGRTPTTVVAKASQPPLRITSRKTGQFPEPGPAGFNWLDYP